MIEMKILVTGGLGFLGINLCNLLIRNGDEVIIIDHFGCCENQNYKVAKKLGIEVEVRNVENPRMEKEEHYYNPDHQHLLDLGYQPTHDIEAEMEIMLNDLMKYKHRIEARAHALIPDIQWDGSRKKVSYL